MGNETRSETEQFEYLFLDLEWNQPIGTTELTDRAAVQIAIVAVDEAMNPVKSFSRAIRLRNPESLNPHTVKLSNVRKLWEGVLEVREIRDVFTGREIVPKQYDVDHFIPWSFVMNDELWNLMPMESSLNSSKSNRLPKWNPFFKDFAYNQYILYGMIHENANIHKRFEVCYGDNLHSIWAGQELYRKGNTEEEFYNILEKNMLPVYESARRQGYEIWEY